MPVPLFRTRHVILLTQTQWTAPLTLSCLFLYSSCASLLHSLVKCVIVSSLSLHILHVTSPSCLSVFNLMALVLNSWSCAAIIDSFVFFLRLPMMSTMPSYLSQKFLVFVLGIILEAVLPPIYPCTSSLSCACAGYQSGGSSKSVRFLPLLPLAVPLLLYLNIYLDQWC